MISEGQLIFPNEIGRFLYSKNDIYCILIVKLWLGNNILS